ncbi:hypothetical protein F5141DRAFT_1201485 [Pisolithus sp. B1]|nr:hypothetical protein F5141DRAFT_1201485 [Pisolithus sp. B1]
MSPVSVCNIPEGSCKLARWRNRNTRRCESLRIEGVYMRLLGGCLGGTSGTPFNQVSKWFGGHQEGLEQLHENVCYPTVSIIHNPPAGCMNRFEEFSTHLEYTFSTVPSVVESLLRLPTVIGEHSMDLPELAEDGCNWQTYSSWVLKAISEDGLMGHLDGSETRPTTPKLLQEYGARWTPQTNKEQDVVMAWKTTDNMWHQRAAMAHQFIIYGLPNSILMLCMHLDTPHEAFAYLECHYGPIPRPESIKVADEAMPQCNMQSEQYLTPETEVIDVRHVEPYLLEVEVGDTGGMWPDECANALEAPDECSQHASNKVEEGNNLLELSSEALKSQGDLPDTTSKRAETQTRLRKPKTEVVDTRQVVNVLPMVEVGTTGQTWQDERTNTLEVSDKRSQGADDKVACWNSPGGHEDPLDSPSDCAETEAGHVKPEAKVVDVRQVGFRLLGVGVGATGVTRPDEHTNVLGVPDEKGQHVDDVAEHANLPESISEALEPADDISRSAGRHSIESGPQTPIKDDQRLQMSGALDTQDPQPADHICDTEGVYLEYAAAILLLYASEKTRPHLEEPGWRETYQGHFVWDTPPDEVWGMGVYGSAGAGWGYGMIVESTAMKLEIRDISAETTHMAPHLLHLETVRKEPDKAETGGGCNDAVSRDPVGSQGVEKTMLAGSGSQHGEHKAKRPRCSPAPCPNGTGHVLRTSRDPRRRGRLKMHAESVSDVNTRRDTHLAQVAPMQHPPCLFGPMKRLRYPTGGYQTMKRGYNQVRRARKVETRGACTGQLAFSCGSFYSSQIFRNDSGTSLIPTGGMGHLPDRRETTRNGRHTFVWPNGCLAAAIRGETTRAPLCITESGNTPQLNDASTQPHHARTTDGLEALHSQNTHSFY